ncbi:MAG: DUF4238 domain-containing protein [Endomicrobium sp.]|jgi:hypothetical protein|nr:DUF4238 domain-containing protein [Endomicrobium sp.]
MPETKNNHYIPQFYISQWKFNDKQVYCLQKENSKIFKTNSRNIFADRIWDNEVENMFAQIENKFWIPIINTILKDKTMDKLSKTELECFLSFAIALKSRKKYHVVEYDKAVKSSFAKFDNELIRDGKAPKKEIEKLQKYDKKIFNYIFLSAFTPDNLFKKGSTFNQFKRLSYDIRIIQENDMQYGQFLTSNCPLLMLNEKDKVYLIMIALTPNLLVFGTKGIETFKAVHNKPINIIIKKFNQGIYNDPNSEYIISNKKSLLEQFL